MYFSYMLARSPSHVIASVIAAMRKMRISRGTAHAAS